MQLRIISPYYFITFLVATMLTSMFLYFLTFLIPNQPGQMYKKCTDIGSTFFSLIPADRVFSRNVRKPWTTSRGYGLPLYRMVSCCEVFFFLGSFEKFTVGTEDAMKEKTFYTCTEAT